VLGHHAGQLLAQLLVPLAEPLEVGGADLDDERVRDEHPALPHDLLLVGGFALEGGCHLDRLHHPAEDAGEGTLDEAFEPTLEALQHSHAGSPSLRLVIVSAHLIGPEGVPHGC